MAIKQYGNTWWGKNWLQSLDNIDYENRLPRGASYARRGMVEKMKIEENIVKAKVAGSRSRPYNVQIVIPPFFEDDINRLMTELTDRPSIISNLLNRTLDPEIMDITEKLGLKVFPSQWNDFKMNCSCPDWAVPCKHLASVIYTLSQEIDNNPFIVFELHKVKLLEELKNRGVKIDNGEMREIPLFFNLMKDISTKEISLEEPSFNRVDFSKLKDIADPIVQLLAPNPPFYTAGDFRERYGKELIRMAKPIKRQLKKGIISQLLSAIPKKEVQNNQVEREISHQMKLHIDFTHDKTYKFDIDDERVNTKNTEPWSIPDFTQAVLNINPDFIQDYHPTIIAFHQALLASIHLFANGALVPQIVRTDKKEYAIRWLPAMIDTEVRKVMTNLNEIIPDTMIQVYGKNKKTPLYITEKSENLCSVIFANILSLFDYRIEHNSIFNLFFTAKKESFSGVGEQEFAGGIQIWLEKYYLTNRNYRPIFEIKELEDDSFALDILIENNTDEHAEAISLKALLNTKKYEDIKFSVLRELTLLSPFVNQLNNYINNKAKDPILFHIEEFSPFLTDILPAMRLLNIKVLLPKSLQHLLRPKPTVRLSKKQSKENAVISLQDCLDFNWQVAVGNEVISPEEFRKLMKRAKGLIRFKQNFIYVDEEDLVKLNKAFTQEKPMSPMQLLQAALIEEFHSAPITLTNEVRDLIEELTKQEDIPLPETINASLRPYQERGYSWMYRNMKIGFGSIIADDMGLGKTLQVITLMLKLKEDGLLEKAKIMVVAPTGLLTNWQAEIERFAPELSLFIYHGTKRDLKQFNADVLITSYGIIRSDATALKRKKWQLLVIDEAQNIKNTNTSQTKAVKSITAGTKIAMSGTPVENRLSEFWSIMDFSNKGYLGTTKSFNEDYAIPIQTNNDIDCVNRFKKITAPFTLRRLKSDKSIISDLPDKIEKNEYAGLSPTQVAIYEETLKHAMSEIEEFEGNDKQALFKRQGLILQMILALKQICNHPTQFLKNGKYDASLSGKTEMLLELVSSIIENDEKVLIFTQFKEMGDMLQGFIEEKLGEQAMFYHGGCSVKQRQEMVERFQNNKTDKIFILSLKAAGTGLNLTAASHVIHYDLWWNPAVEAQATDRAYRIGQNKNVISHRMICKGTFEEKIDEMIQRKKALADLTVATGENWIGKMSNKELRELFG